MGGPVARFVAKVFLKLARWEPEGERPVARRFVLIAAPHTSNWDLAFLLAFAVHFDVKISWMGKHVLFGPPFGWVMRRLGGVPVVRHERRNMVQQMAAILRDAKQMALVVPAEGTRSYVPYWKSGFYYIAREAEVPIVLGYLDFARRRGGFGPPLLTTDDVTADMDQIRDFYSDKKGKYPELFGEVRLKEES